jgi:hypothetical protein
MNIFMIYHVLNFNFNTNYTIITQHIILNALLQTAFSAQIITIHVVL